MKEFKKVKGISKSLIDMMRKVKGQNSNIFGKSKICTSKKYKGE
jgi:hypothetical protein